MAMAGSCGGKVASAGAYTYHALLSADAASSYEFY